MGWTLGQLKAPARVGQAVGLFLLVRLVNYLIIYYVLEKRESVTTSRHSADSVSSYTDGDAINRLSCRHDINIGVYSIYIV